MEAEGEGSPAEDLEADFLKLENDGTVSDVNQSPGNGGVGAGSECSGEEIFAAPSPSRSLPSLGVASGSNMRRLSGGSGVIGGRKNTLRTSISLVSNYSSSSEEEKEAAPRIRRRKKRKRPVGEIERMTRQKAVWIEEALRNGDKDRLAQLAVGHGGLLSDEIRVRVWPQLIGMSLLETGTVLPAEEDITAHQEYNQVVMDVNRSLKRFPPGIEESARPELQEQLTRLIIRVMLAQPSLHYYQGYHDVAITFLLVVGEELAFQIMERLSVSHLKQFMAPTMEQTMGLLELMYPLIQRSQPSLYAHLMGAELGTVFALPWLITWFGHVLPDYSDVVRLYDFFLAGPPLMPIYLATAIVLHRQEEILASECEMSAIHGLLSRIPVNLPFEDLLVSCQALYEALPPHVVEEDARRSRQQEKERQMMRRRGREAVPSKGLRQVIAQIVIYGAPVFLGLVVWRLYSSPS